MSGNIYTNIVAHNVKNGNFGGVDGPWGKYANNGAANPFKIYEFKIIDGKVFEATDSNGLSDPYVKVFKIKVNEKKEEEKKLLFKTQISKKTLSPTWNFSGLYAVPSRVEKLYLELWDNDLLRDDFIGGTKIKLSDVPKYEELKEKLNIHNNNNKHSGTVNISISNMDYTEENQLKCANWKNKEN